MSSVMASISVNALGGEQGSLPSVNMIKVYDLLFENEEPLHSYLSPPLFFFPLPQRNTMEMFHFFFILLTVGEIFGH